MQKVLVIALLAASVAMPVFGTPVWAQQTPHDFKQDTPPVPGQVVERPRDELRVAPLPMRGAQFENTGLPLSGPMGVTRGPRSERLYRPPVR